MSLTAELQRKDGGGTVMYRAESIPLDRPLTFDATLKALETAQQSLLTFFANAVKAAPPSPIISPQVATSFPEFTDEDFALGSAEAAEFTVTVKDALAEESGESCADPLEEGIDVDEYLLKKSRSDMGSSWRES